MFSFMAACKLNQVWLCTLFSYHLALTCFPRAACCCDLSSHCCLQFERVTLHCEFLVYSSKTQSWRQGIRGWQEARFWLLDSCRVLWLCPALAQWRGSSDCAVCNNGVLKGENHPAVLSHSSQLKTWCFTWILSWSKVPQLKMQLFMK